MSITPAISTAMRDVLIEHMDGAKVKFVVVAVGYGLESCASQSRLKTTTALLQRGLIRFDSPHSRQYTVINEAGRFVLATMLGDYADALAKANKMLGFDERSVWLAAITTDDFIVKTSISREVV